MKKYFYNSKGFSLIEVLIFVAIIGIFFTAAISVSVSSLSSMKVSENRVIATKYAEELLEWLRAEKESNWTLFLTNIGISNGTVCKRFNNTIISWTTDSCTLTNKGLDPLIYKRTATFVVTPTQVKVKIVVEWEQSGITYSVPLDSQFVPWQ